MSPSGGDPGFDFWVGEWDLTWGDGATGSNRITKILGGCVILEEFDAHPTTELRGMSVSSYSEKLGHWQQTWVDNAGGYFHLTGGMRDGRMVLEATGVEGGAEISLRMLFFDIKRDSFEWSWEKSTDGGSAWTPLWRIHYARRA